MLNTLSQSGTLFSFIRTKFYASFGDRFGKVYVYRKNPIGNQPQVECAQLEKVGFEKFFYDMTGFTSFDVQVVSQLIEHMQKDKHIKLGLNMELLPEANDKRDFMEGLICRYEDIDNKYQFLEKLISGDLSFYRNTMAQETLDEFHRFFFMQHQRAPVVHEAQRKNIEEIKSEHAELKDIHTGFYINSLMIYFAETIAVNVSQNMHTWIERYENKTDIPFITSDTPVVNLTGMEFLPRNEFYYPISPKIAIKLCLARKSDRSNHGSNACLEITDTKEVEKLNRVMAENCYREVYADSEEVFSNMS
jgi:hypothetical protein